MITKIIRLNVKPEQSKTFKNALIENKINGVKEAGCIESRLFIDSKDSHLFFSYERFVDEAALAAHKEQPHTQKLVRLFETALATPLECLNLGDTQPAPVAVSAQKQPNPGEDAFVIFFIFKFKEGYREKLLNRFEEHITQTRTEDGNLLFDLYTVDGQDDTLVVYEHWRKESDVWDIHFKQPYSDITGSLMHEAVIGDLEQYMNFAKEIA